MASKLKDAHSDSVVVAAVMSGKHRNSVGGMWDEIGGLQRDFVLGEGLTPDMRLLDIGCGCLRAGVHFVRYLNAGWEEQAGYTAYTWNTSRYIESPGDEVITLTDLPPLTGLPPDPTDGEWHTYRVEIRGDTLSMYIDGVLMIEATGLQYQGYGDEGRVGILVSLGAVEIRAFRVIAWE